MKKKLVAGATAIFMMLVSFVGMILVAPAANAGAEKIGICHKNEGAKGFVYLEVAKDGAVGGHADHQNNQDIIPAFTWIEKVNGVNTKMYFPGLNTTKSESEFSAADCGTEEEEEKFIPVTMAAPSYIPASCGNPAFEDGQLVLPATVTGVTVTDVKDNGLWVVTYALEEGYQWETVAPGSDEFEARVWEFPLTHISADELWVVDSKTGVGGCEMPRTGGGISEQALMLGGGAIGVGMLALAGSMMLNRKRVEI